MEKIKAYVENYAIYYENYYTLSTLMLQYEELLHNSYTRELVVEGAISRRAYITKLFQDALDAGEIRADMVAENMSDLVYGYIHVACLKRRLGTPKGSFRKEIILFIDLLIKTIAIVKDGGAV